MKMRKKGLKHESYSTHSRHPGYHTFHVLIVSAQIANHLYALAIVHTDTNIKIAV